MYGALAPFRFSTRSEEEKVYCFDFSKCRQFLMGRNRSACYSIANL